jgi:hypothetical protein
MTINQILQQLQGMGFTGPQGGIGGAANISQTDIMNVMENMYNLEGMLSPSMFQTINPAQLAGTLSKTYSPMVETKTENLLNQLLRTTTGSLANKPLGGFASSGQYNKYLESARDVYGQGATDVLANVGLQKSQASQSIEDIITDWQTQAAEVAA